MLSTTHKAILSEGLTVLSLIAALLIELVKDEAEQPLGL